MLASRKGRFARAYSAKEKKKENKKERKKVKRKNVSGYLCLFVFVCASDSNPGSSAFEVDALTTRTTRRWVLL